MGKDQDSSVKADETEFSIVDREDNSARPEPILEAAAGQRLPDVSDLWRRLPSVAGDSGRFLEEDR